VLPDPLSTLRGSMRSPRSRASSNATAPALRGGASVLTTACALLLCAAGSWTARAEPLGPFFERSSLVEPGYELRLSVGYYTAERPDFRQLVFLVSQPVQRITAYELRSELDFRLSITQQLALQVVLPVTVRAADVELQNLVVSRTQALPGQTLELRGAGIADPTLALGYRVLEHDMFRLQLDLGTRVPIDDNPGSPILPERLPLGTGQNQLFVGAGGGLRGGRFELSLGYRFEYHPGTTATYLVRQIGGQGYTSGALDTFLAHRVSAMVSYAFDSVWAVQLAPDFRVEEQPLLVERDSTTAFLPDAYRYELLFTASIEARFDPQNALRLRYSQPLLRGWDEDPFFPISIPEQGVRLTWIFSAR
jgi:hypothetical protein